MCYFGIHARGYLWKRHGGSRFPARVGIEQLLGAVNTGAGRGFSESGQGRLVSLGNQSLVWKDRGGYRRPSHLSLTLGRGLRRLPEPPPTEWCSPGAERRRVPRRRRIGAGLAPPAPGLREAGLRAGLGGGRGIRAF